ncbi:DUF4296 domain-containing protein [Winogradskyella sp.]|uniref:DUF4296 domain-containing protein n=1 Tax=Winogradskyella sp. TaxID=1883156 RepID=UPI0026375062|nr:DUF4296 domain-containing protein [Winogradskyella sp.]
MGFFFLFFACEDKNKPKKPQNLIPKDQMEKIIYDLYIITSAKGVNKKVLEENNIIPETYILTKHNIDSLQFAESNDYYAFDSEGYKIIIDNVKKRLQEEKEYFEELQKKEAKATKRRRDSISKVNSKIKKDSIVKTKKLTPIN